MTGTKPQSPYKSQQVQQKEVCFNVSSQDLKDFRFRFATHGSTDAIMATLFYHFVNAAREHLPLADSSETEESNNRRFVQMIPELKFPF